MFSSKFETSKLGIVGAIVIVLIIIALAGIYLWVLWMIAGAILGYLNYTGADEFWLRVFIMIVTSAVLGALGRIGIR